MILTLHKLRIHLQSEDAEINWNWRQLFDGWPLSSHEIRTPADLCLRLNLSDTLPPLPDTPPFFTDKQEWPNMVGILSVYREDERHVLLHFGDGAVVKVLVEGVHPSEPVKAVGQVTSAALEHGRFEDITFTSLAPLLRRSGYYLVHAFAASKNGRGVLIVGPSGSGKTTTGISLLLDGWELLSNDTLLLEQRSEGIYALPTPGGISIRPNSVDLLPALRPIIGNRSLVMGKYDLTSSQLIGNRWSKPVPIQDIYFPTIIDQEDSRRQRISRAVCLAQLMEESVDSWDSEMIPTHMNLLQQLSQQAAPYTLLLGRKVHQLPLLFSTDQ